VRRKQRLRRPDQFSRVRREGKTWAHTLLVMNAVRNRAGRTRCGFVVGKQLGKAHDRNRAKRRAREAVRLVYPQIAHGWDIVFIVRAPCVTAQFPAVVQAVQDLLRRAGIWVVVEESTGSRNASSNRADAHPRISAPLAPDPA